MKKKVIFIISSGRSGSTLLCKFLGMHSQCFPLSEPQRYDMATETNGFCSCGETLLDCPFWESVRQELEKKGYPDGKMDTSRIPFYTANGIWNKANAYFRLYCFSKGADGTLNEEYLEQLNNEANLLRAISKLSEKPVLIDASKSLIRAIAISRLLKDEFDPHYIHLYRYPVAVVYSSMKKNMSVKLDDQEIVYSKDSLPSLKEATDNWCRGNRSNLLLCKFFKIPPIYICYEEFTKNPKDTFEKLSPSVGLNWEEKMLDLSQEGHHMVSGNLSRINAKHINPASDEWLKMDVVDQKFIQKKTRSILAKIESK